MASGTVPSAEVAIIGLGVIGGSAALRLRHHGTALVTFSTSSADNAMAAAAGIPVAATVDEAVRQAGLVLIAVPLDAVATVAQSVAGAAPPRATILHAASLQRREAIDAMPEIADRIIGTHPLAGSHRTGFAAAAPDLFHLATVYVERRANARQREDAELFWSLAGAAHIEYASAEQHDRAMAWTSHLPQVASTALAATLARAAVSVEGSRDRLVSRPGPGARDATRLAMSALDIWRPILQRAPQATLDALRTLEEEVQALRAGLEEGDWNAVQNVWERAQRWRSSIESDEGEPA
jgi:prephenate dehydrogenase